MTVISVWLDAWTVALGRACWQGGLLVLIAWILCRFVRSMPARFQCWFWRLALLKFFLVLICPIPLRLPWLPAPPPVASEPEITVMTVPTLATSPANQMSSGKNPEHGISCVEETLFLAWIIGIGWSSVRLLALWQTAKRLRKQGKVISDPSIVQQLAMQREAFALRFSPQLLEIPGSGSPMTIGVFRPVVVIPSETLHNLTVSEQAMVLGHELAHVRRGDLCWSLVAALVRSVFFFHPLAWLTQRQLNLAQEIAADELAIDRQHHDPTCYGRLLVSVIGKLGTTRLLPTMSMGTSGPIESLTRRLVAMTFMGRKSRRVIFGSSVLMAMTMLLGLVPWQLVGAEPKAVVQARLLPPKGSAEVMASAAKCAENTADSKERNQQLLFVKLKVSEHRAGKPEDVLCRPHIVTLVGQDGYVMVSGGERQLNVEIRPSLRSDKIETVIATKLIHDPEGKTPVVLTLPDLTIDDVRKLGTATLEVKQQDSSLFRVEATVALGTEANLQSGSSTIASVEKFPSPAKATLTKVYVVADMMDAFKDGSPEAEGLIQRIKSQARHRSGPITAAPQR